MLKPSKTKTHGIKGEPKTHRPPKPPSQRINKDDENIKFNSAKGGNKMVNGAERLQEVKESWVSEGHMVKIDREHFDWLTEQTERTEYYMGLAEYRMDLIKQKEQEYQELVNQFQQAQEENEKLRKQLSMLCPIADLPVINTLLVEKQVYMEHISKLNNLLKRLYEAAAKLDAEHCTYLNRGEYNLSVDDYEKIVDVFIEVEEYLKEIE